MLEDRLLWISLRSLTAVAYYAPPCVVALLNDLRTQKFPIVSNQSHIMSCSMLATCLRVPGARASKQGAIGKLRGNTSFDSPFLGKSSRVVTRKWIQHLFSSLHVLEASAASYSLKTDWLVSQQKMFPGRRPLSSAHPIPLQCEQLEPWLVVPGGQV